MKIIIPNKESYCYALSYQTSRPTTRWGGGASEESNLWLLGYWSLFPVTSLFRTRQLGHVFAAFLPSCVETQKLSRRICSPTRKRPGPRLSLHDSSLTFL